MSEESCGLDVENEEPLTLHGTLEALSLFDYISTFEKEKMDMESLVLPISWFILFKLESGRMMKHSYIRVYST